MISVRTVYPDCTETRSTYTSLRGDAIAMARAINDCDEFQRRGPVSLADVAAVRASRKTTTTTEVAMIITAKF
jgi:hypothetical protein